MNILAMNAGSSSQKSRLYRIEGEQMPALAPFPPLWEADITWQGPSGAPTATITTNTAATTSGGAHLERSLPQDRGAALDALLATLWEGPTAVVSGPDAIDAVGHRIVQGGREFTEGARITPAVRATIEHLSPLAPEHNPPALEGIAAAERSFGRATPQVAVFDTAFHAHLPLAAAVYPGPYSWYEQGIRRFGFHGISFQYCTERAAQMLGREVFALRMVLCHLGSGASLAAVVGGRSVETTMGFTPLEGLMMGTRSGTVDPGILFYLQRERGQSAAALEATLNHGSGLKGISGLGGDMRDVLAARAQGDPRAVLAFDMFVHRVRFYIGALLGVLGGLDALVFTGGIGEHTPEVRAGACETLGFAGVRLDTARNAHPSLDANVASGDSSVPVLVIAAQEDWMIARECARVVRK